MSKTRTRNKSNRRHTFAKVQAAIGEPEPISEPVAMAMLEQVLSYCLQAGLTVRAGNSPMLTIQVESWKVAPNGKLAPLEQKS